MLFTLVPALCLAGVTRSGSTWTIKENAYTVQFDESTFDVDVSKTGGSVWKMSRESRSQELVINGASRSLTSASSRSFSEYHSGGNHGVMATLKSFSGASSVQIRVYIYINVPRDELVIELDPVKDPDMLIGECRYPRGFRIGNSGSNYFVNPSGYKGYGSLTSLGGGKSMNEKLAYAHDHLYMAWWGLLKDYSRSGHKGEGLIAMAATPYDFSLNADNSNGYTIVYGKWRTSLERLRYKRRMCYALYSSDCDYVTLSLRYRKFLEDENRIKTLSEKASINPNVNKLRGIVHFHNYISQCAKPNPRWFRYTFDDVKNATSQFVGRFNKTPRLLLHLREWHEGEISDGGTAYDLNANGPMLQAGGWDGLRRLSDWCDQNDHFLYLYDTFSDIAMISEQPLYDPAMTIRRSNGSIWSHNWWCGNDPYAGICPVKRLQLFQNNLQVFRANGINIKAIYLDITCVREPFECYSTDHDHGAYGDPVTGHLSREGFCRYIDDFYTWCAEEGIIVISEGPSEWAWRFVAGSFFFIPKSANLSSGSYVPLLHLVAHDVLIGGDYVDTYHLGADPKLFLPHLLHGAIPLPKENLKDDAVWAEKISDLHEMVGFERMIDHDFVGGTSYIQRTTFANNVQVEVNYNTGAYSINGGGVIPPDTTPPAPPVNVKVSFTN